MDTAKSEIANLLKLERYYRDTAQWDLCRAAFHPSAASTYINVAWFVERNPLLWGEAAN